MSTITLPKLTYRIECPPTILPNALITLCGESAGKQELTWHECSKCGAGIAYGGFCNCGGIRAPKPQGFVGSSGQMLRRICSNAGVAFDHCNRTNVIKRYPPEGSFANMYVDPKKRTIPTEELKWWRELLIAELTKHRPNIVVALGDEALRALTGLEGITKWSGSIITSPFIPGLKVIPMVHPAYIMRDNWGDYYINIRFMKRAAVESAAPHIIQGEPNDKFIVKPTLLQVLEFLTHIQTSNQPWTLDVETRGDTISCFGLSSYSRPGSALCVPIHTTTGPYWSVNEEAQIWRALSLAARDNPLFENQNVAYDLDYILDYGVEPASVNFDPMVAMNFAYPEFPKGLDFTCALYTRYKYYKDEGKTWLKRDADEKIWNYNCKDMVVTPTVSRALKADLIEKHQLSTWEKRAKAFLPIAIEMQRNRLRVHKEWHKRLAEICEEERILAHQRLTQHLGREINVKSSRDVGRLLYEELKLPIKYKRGSDNPSTQETLLRELRAEHSNVPELNMILEERHLRTKQSNYIFVEFDEDPDGELYLPYMSGVSLAKTGRWAFHKSPKWRGSSPQTVTKVMRLQYQPPEGSVFWQRDLSQAEARIVAWLSNCRFLLDTFAGKTKIHKVVGGMIYGRPPEQIDSDSQEYDISKRVVHAYNYMMQYRKFAITASISYEKARRDMELYGRGVPEITAWHKRTAETAIKAGRLTTPFGRVRECYAACSAVTHTGKLPDEILRDLVSYVPQSIVPDALGEGMLTLWQSFPAIRWHMQGHDSWLASGPADWTNAIYEASERAHNSVRFRINDFDCMIPGEFQWGYLWGAMLSYKPGEDTSYDAWLARATAEGCFDEAKIKKRLYAMV